MESKFEKLLSKTDPILEKIIFQVPEPIIDSTNNVFHDLISCILEQQIHYRSTKKTFQKLLNIANIERLTTDNFKHFEEKSFANLKLSISKYQTIISVINYWEQNKIDWQSLSDEEVITRLSSIKGIGKWTIDMILLYTLKRPNIFPFDDYHLKQIMIELYKLNPNIKLKAQMIEISENWNSQKSLAVLYLLSWKKQNKNSI